MATRREQKSIEVEGIQYTLYHPGLQESIRMHDRCKNESGVQLDEVLYRELMEHVIRLRDGTKVDFEYFEENPGFMEVMAEARAFTFKQPKSNRFYRQKAKEHWLMWRLVMEKVIDYATASVMTLDELLEANAALDIHIENINKANKKGGRK
ncbi:hypothetical protein [Pseudobacillus badius]|uniref:hypothetical protein n=1 Tax=Bacillus badius TaxID=1455 RepID=UPI0007B32A7B|nr:hypothetical protein [Bacillus badius]KZR58973.1 hypothetical protein A3781_00245 [Bacillus badius]